MVRRCLVSLLLLCAGLSTAETAKPPANAALQGEFGVLNQQGALIEHRRIKDGKRHGEQRYYYERSGENGQEEGRVEKGPLRRIAQYRNGVQSGLEQWFDRAGHLTEEIPYRNNQVHGQVRRYYPDGNLREQVCFVRGKKNGVFSYFDESGRVTARGTAQSAGIVETRFWGKDGELTQHQVEYRRDSEGRFLDNAPLWLIITARYHQHQPIQADIHYAETGERWLERFEKGALVEIHHTVNGLPEGLNISRKGTRVYRETYVKGRLHGPWRLQTATGTPLLWGQYRDGKRVGEWHQRGRDGTIETINAGDGG
ncbi:antitoxin component YwqK of YwqJK toxin-antitoxin module [Alloalcanivorax xenomutans]|nr:antitoxin component YwqK of YwqJK toxin-antitoxin module [Alloalcanivorax xenomutans]